MIKTFNIGLFLCLSLVTITSLFAQSSTTNESQNIPGESNSDILILARHLPNWETKKNEITFIENKKDLHNTLGEKSVFGAIDFSGDTKAVAANYDEGRLLLVEFGTPQASINADKRIKENLTENSQSPAIYYKRIGNYNVFVFDGTSQSSANTLFDQIKYQQIVRWLNGDPLIRQRAERRFIRQTSSLFIATVMIIVLGFVFAIVAGIIVGIIFYNIRKRKRATMEIYSDNGGLTRLNLDDLTPDITTE